MWLKGIGDLATSGEKQKIVSLYQRELLSPAE